MNEKRIKNMIKKVDRYNIDIKPRWIAQKEGFSKKYNQKLKKDQNANKVKINALTEK
jgi:hypothetical protein